MIYFEYIFHCSRFPSKLTLHSIASHFFGTKDLTKFSYKVHQEGKKVKVITNEDIQKDFEIELVNKDYETFTCKLLRRKEHEVEEFTKDDEVTISGIIEYGINFDDIKGKRCPIFLGKFENTKVRNHFKQHIEKQLGVKIPNMERKSFSKLESEIADDHIHFNNVIDMDLVVTIEDPETFNKIAYTSYFQKKSYGFGNLEVIAH
jgi:hypothetical protein